MRWWIGLLFTVSGATALVGEVVWMRMLGLVLGNTVWAASAAVAVWMAGMALGAAIAARLAPRIRHHLIWYGAAEGLIGIFFALSPRIEAIVLRFGTLVGDDLGNAMLVGVAERFVLACAVLLVPTLLMGLTLPLLVERLRDSSLVQRVGTLYGLNTLGAAGGVFLTAYLLLPVLGERGSLAAAAVACAGVCVAAFVGERHLPAVAVAVPQPSPSRKGARGHLVLVAAMGFAALAAEIVWVRILVLSLGSRVYAFAILLGVYLVGLSVGSLAVRALGERLRDPRRALARVQLAAAIALAVQVPLLGFSDDIMAWPAHLLALPASFPVFQLVMLQAIVILFLPVTALFGASFPLAVAADPAARSDGAHAGAIAAANTVGSIFGALAAPFVLVPMFGSQRTLLVLALIHLAVALGVSRRRGLVVAAAAAGAVVMTLGAVLPADWVLRRAGSVSGDSGVLRHLSESVSATVVVKDYLGHRPRWRSLELNGMNVAGTDASLLVVQQLQGNLPLLQVTAPRRVLHIGFGSGGTCWAVSRYPVERIDVVEISPEVLAASNRWFADVNRGVLGDPRVHIVVNDGRNYLLATEARYDAILSDSIHPLYAGNSTLYTREYFRLCRDHLEPGGVVSMWLPLYSLDSASYLRILRAFHEVFPHTVVWYDVTTVNENTVVTGQVAPGPVSIDWRRFLDSRVARSLAIGGIGTPDDLARDLLLAPDEVERVTRDVPPLIDDVPYVEYLAARLLSRSGTWEENLRMLAGAASRGPSPFAEGAAIDWPGAVRGRDARLRAVLDELFEDPER